MISDKKCSKLTLSWTEFSQIAYYFLKLFAAKVLLATSSIENEPLSQSKEDWKTAKKTERWARKIHVKGYIELNRYHEVAKVELSVPNLDHSSNNEK